MSEAELVTARGELRQAAFDAHQVDWPRASALWQAYRLLYPDEADGYVFEVLSLREQRAFDQAEQLFDEVSGRFSVHSRLFVERAIISMQKRDWEVASRRFAEIRRQFPREIEGYICGAEVAENMGRIEQALELLKAAAGRFTDNRRAVLRYAHLASRAAELAEAAAAWRLVRTAWPDLDSFVAEAIALATAEQFGTADAVLVDAAALYPGADALAHAAARIATQRADWASAMLQWRVLVGHPVHDAEARSRLRDAERFASGNSVLSCASLATAALLIGETVDGLLERHWTFRFDSGQVLGRNIRLGANGALLNHFGDSRRWDVRGGALCFLDGEDRIITRFTSIEAETDGPLRLRGRDWVHGTIDSFFVLQDEGPSLAAIFDRFVSLGNNCEFGLVQRFYGTEPLGLLRFNWTDLDCLLAGLDSDFAELAVPGCVEVVRVPDGELIGEVPAYKYRYHTHRYDTDIDMAAFAQAESGRLRYLARKLTEDMEDGEKIYVRKGETPDELPRILELADRLKQRGDCWLLWVTEADADHAPGMVERVGDRLLRGTVERHAPVEAAGRATFHDWAVLCRRVARLVGDQTRNAGR